MHVRDESNRETINPCLIEFLHGSSVQNQRTSEDDRTTEWIGPKQTEVPGDDDDHVTDAN